MRVIPWITAVWVWKFQTNCFIVNCADGQGPLNQPRAESLN